MHAAWIPLLERLRFVVTHRAIAFQPEAHVKAMLVRVATRVTETGRRLARAVLAHDDTATDARPSITTSPD